MKTQGIQDVIHFVARDILFEDYVSSLGYYLTLQYDGNFHYIYPTYYESVIGQEDASDSHISKVFTKAFQLIYQISQKYVMNEDEFVQLEESINRFF